MPPNPSDSRSLLHRNERPTHLAITLSALGHRYSHQGWLCASQIAANLKLLGFETDGRRLAATLAHMCRVDAPWLERRRANNWNDDSEYEYRVTQWGRNDIDNKLQGVTAHGVSGFGVAA